MIHEPDSAAGDSRAVHSSTSFRTAAGVQGLYFLVTGVSPLVHVESFLAVTGPKTDLWLVYTVGVLVGVIGLTLLAAMMSGRIPREILILAIGSAVVLAAIDVIFVVRGVISAVYLFDAVVEAVLVLWWLAAGSLGRSRARPPRALFGRERIVAMTEQGSTPTDVQDPINRFQ
jgi:hypothetical protein